MSTEGKYSIDEIKQAMISRQGQAFEEATLWAQQYLALRTPGTAFANAIVSGVRKPDDLASAFFDVIFPVWAVSRRRDGTAWAERRVSASLERL